MLEVLLNGERVRPGMMPVVQKTLPDGEAMVIDGRALVILAGALRLRALPVAFGKRAVPVAFGSRVPPLKLVSRLSTCPNAMTTDARSCIIVVLD